MTKYSKFMYYWSAMVCAIDDNEIEIQNLLLEKIEEMLPFKDAQEQKEWCDVVATYKFFENFETATMRIARRLSKKESLKTVINEEANL